MRSSRSAWLLSFARSFVLRSGAPSCVRACCFGGLSAGTCPCVTAVLLSCFLHAFSAQRPLLPGAADGDHVGCGQHQRRRHLLEGHAGIVSAAASLCSCAASCACMPLLRLYAALALSRPMCPPFAAVRLPETAPTWRSRVLCRDSLLALLSAWPRRPLPPKTTSS